MRGYALFETTLGSCAIAWAKAGITHILLPQRSRAALRRTIAERCGPLSEEPPPVRVRKAVALVQRHLRGEPIHYDAGMLDLSGMPPFRRSVYQALLRTRTGETVSYGELAKRAGSPKAARAVGQAMAHNPLPIVVPCHRVLAAGGKAGGFSAYGGVVTKSKLLAIEGVELDSGSPAERDDALFRGRDSLPFERARALRSLRRRDPQLAACMKQVGPFTLQLKKPRTTFAALAEAIVYQQLSGKAAATIFGRLKALYPKRRALTAGDVATTSQARLRSAGLSRAKALAITDLAERTCAREIPTLSRLRTMDDEAIVETLTRVRGIGRWTVEMLLMFQLGRPDVLPAADLGVRKGYALVFGSDELPSADELLAHGERWRPWRTVASWYLWRALDG
jgi:O-6-methylguanine DNA methyltransferase